MLQSDKALLAEDSNPQSIRNCEWTRYGENSFPLLIIAVLLFISGRILILSNQETSEKEAYELYKRRETVEKRLDAYKSTLSADSLYLQDDESVFGHVFIAFLSLYAYSKLELLLKKADLNEKMTPIDLFFDSSTGSHYHQSGGRSNQ